MIVCMLTFRDSIEKLVNKEEHMIYKKCLIEEAIKQGLMIKQVLVQGHTDTLTDLD